MPSQAQKHVTHNEALRILHIRVAAMETDIPPEEPQEGAHHVVGGAPSGVFAGHDRQSAAV